MTKIKFGEQHGDSVANHQVISNGGESELTFGDQHDRSRLSSQIFDLKNSSDLALISTQLSIIANQIETTPEGKAHPEDVSALNDAAAHILAGNADSAKKRLLGVGKWVLKTASAVGTPLVVEFLKSYI